MVVAEETLGVALAVLCGAAALINGMMMVVFLTEKKRKRSSNLTYLNLSTSDFLWALYGTLIMAPGMLI